MTPSEFYWACYSKMQSEVDLVKYLVQTGYEVARYLGLHIWNAQGRLLKHQVKDPKDLGIFSWEREKLTPVQSMEEMKLQMKRIAKTFAKRKKVL